MAVCLRWKPMDETLSLFWSSIEQHEEEEEENNKATFSHDLLPSPWLSNTLHGSPPCTTHAIDTTATSPFSLLCSSALLHHYGPLHSSPAPCHLTRNLLRGFIPLPCSFVHRLLAYVRFFDPLIFFVVVLFFVYQTLE